MDILSSLFSELDLLVFSKTNKHFTLISDPPSWSKYLFPSIKINTDTLFQEDTFAFLNNFLIDADKFWEAENSKSNSLKSGIWVQVDNSGNEFLFESIVKKINQEQVLLIHLIGDSSSKIKKDFQIARDNLLEIEKLDQITKKLEVRAKDLNQKNQNLEEFAFVASHDLQEPLKKVLMFSRMIRDNFFDHIPQEAKGYLDITIDASERMIKLVNDLLEYSRVSYSTEEAIEVDLNLIVKNILNDFSLKIIDKNADIVPDILPKIIGRGSQLRILFQNLISNALKFNEKKSPKVHIKYKKEFLEDCFAIEIIDNGIGIEKEQIDYVFGIFNRIHGRERFEGSGIGLSKCKKIAEIHFGSIEVESEIGKGTTFRLIFPNNIISY